MQSQWDCADTHPWLISFSLDHSVTQYELESLWVKSQLPTVAYPFDTRVRAISGDHAGRIGRVVALLSLDPSPLYVVEAPDETSFNARRPDLEDIDTPIDLAGNLS
jgi:hypothetical protein